MADLPAWRQRLDLVESRLQALAATTEGQTDPDPSTGEQWEVGQVWGHIAEFSQFWVEQAGAVVDAYQGDPVPFGRTLDDPTRAAGIEQGLHTNVEALWLQVQSGLVDLRAFLDAAPKGWEEAVGLHPIRGEVPAGRIIDNHVIRHLEEHADQLERLTRKLSGSGS